MNPLRFSLILLAAMFTATAEAQEPSALTCADFVPTQEALDRFPNLRGACEAIVERDGELFARFTAVVRRVSGNNVTLYLPATDNTFRVRPDSSLRVLMGGRKMRPRDLVRGQEIGIYLPTRQFARPNIEEVAFVTEADIIVNVPVEKVEALPTTGSLVPAMLASGLLLLGAAFVLRRRRLRAGVVPLVLLGLAVASIDGEAQAQTTTVQKPLRVVTTEVQRAAIVEAVDKETRELKLLDARGERFTVVADELVANFDQIEPRDRIIVTYFESVALMAVPEGTPTLGSGVAVELAPLGGRPGVSGVQTFVVKATVEAINISDRLATVRREGGELIDIKVGEDVPLDLVEVGDEVRLRISTATAVSVRPAPAG